MTVAIGALIYALIQRESAIAMREERNDVEAFNGRLLEESGALRAQLRGSTSTISPQDVKIPQAPATRKGRTMTASSWNLLQELHKSFERKKSPAKQDPSK